MIGLLVGLVVQLGLVMVTRPSTRDVATQRSARRGRFASVASRLTRRVRRRRARRVAPTDWALVLADAARSMRSGESLMTALARQPDHADTAARWMMGTPIAQVFEPAGSAHPDERLAFAVMRTVAEVGGNAALALDRGADAIRDRQQLRAERVAQSAQARASAWVLTSVGPLFAVWTVASDDAVRGFVFGSPTGWVCAVVGIGLNLAGWLWMRRIVTVAE